MGKNLRLPFGHLVLIVSLALVFLTIGASYGVATLTADRFVKRQAENFAEDWARFISGRIPNLGEIASGGALSEDDRKLLVDVKDFGDVFRFKLFSPDGRLRLVSDNLDKAPNSAEESLGAHNEKAAAVVSSGIAFTSVEDGTQKPNRPDVYAESYVPVIRNGVVVAISEVYIDQSEAAASAQQDYLRLGLEIAALIILFMTGPVIGILLLLRSLRRKNAALEIETENARRADQAKSDFLANVSHELRTPMNGVLGMAQVLRMGDLSDSQKNQLNILINSAESQMLIISDLLDFSKIENGSFELDTAPFRVDEVLNDVFELQLPSAKSKGLNFNLSSPATPLPTVVGDQQAVRQIFTNIVGNAVKFTDTGSVDVAMAAESGDEATVVRFSVSDTGPGIPWEHHEKIFDRFSQVDSSSTRAAGGTGLGLTITKSLVDLMGGEIALESELGKGSTFTVVLSLKEAPVEGDADAQAA